MQPVITPLSYTYKKRDSDVWVLNTKDIPLDFTQIKDTQVVNLAPQSTGGNHKHQRTEWFVAIGELEFSWLDEVGSRQSLLMNPNGQLHLIEVPPFLPHAVRNISDTKGGILFEFGDGELLDVTDCEVI